MREGYNVPATPDDPFSDLDEYLCEYVDGTMEPAVRVVFEEYLQANPDLAQHVQCLCRTRSQLCQYSTGLRAPNGFQSQLRRRLAREMMRPPSPLWSRITTQLGSFATVGSVLVIVFMTGLLVGVVQWQEESTRTSSTRTFSPTTPSLAPTPAMTPQYFKGDPLRPRVGTFVPAHLTPLYTPPHFPATVPASATRPLHLVDNLQRTFTAP